MTVYVVALINIADREGYGRYEEGFIAIFERHGGTMLAVDEAPSVLEGEWPWTRTVLISFPDRAALDAWYNSADYQALAQHRFQASQASISVVQGFG